VIIDSILIILGGLCVITGLIGCILPVLPGPLIGYARLILLHLSRVYSFSANFLINFALLTLLVAVLDYVIPIYGTKKLEGSKYGVWGSTLGMVAGIFILFPIGIVIGPMIGAFGGEIISGKKANKAFKPALGSFLGFMASTVVRLLLTAVMAYYYGLAVYNIYFIS
jgi:uncharacterized protein YqgC (DUF456 family)